MENFLFSSSHDSNLLRYFRLGEEWHECFVVEFILGSDHYEHLYWGNQVYVEEDRHIISLMLTTAYLPDPQDKWKKQNLEIMHKGIDFTLILRQAEKEINNRMSKTMQYETI